jgi:Ca2+-binding RTX toxin-like protein
LIIENTGEGTDTVETSLNYRLGSNIENLILTHTGKQNGTGNLGDNTIIGNRASNTIKGLNGDDYLTGGGGSDLLQGGGGADTLIGAGGGNKGKNTIDTLTGGTGGDLLILGNSNSTFYNDGKNNSSGLADYALIVGFSKNLDIIQLRGTEDDYLLGDSPVSGLAGKGIYWDTNGDSDLNSSDELIAIVRGAKIINLSAEYFSFV